MKIEVTVIARVIKDDVCVATTSITREIEANGSSDEERYYAGYFAEANASVADSTRKALAVMFGDTK